MRMAIHYFTPGPVFIAEITKAEFELTVQYPGGSCNGGMLDFPVCGQMDSAKIQL